jgi:hypothetical protein
VTIGKPGEEYDLYTALLRELLQRRTEWLRPNLQLVSRDTLSNRESSGLLAVDQRGMRNDEGQNENLYTTVDSVSAVGWLSHGSEFENRGLVARERRVDAMRAMRNASAHAAPPFFVAVAQVFSLRRVICSPL